MPSKRKNPKKWTQDDIHDWHMMLIAKRQIEMALYSFDEMEVANDALRFGKTRNDGDFHRMEIRLWSSAQAFLASLVQVSDLFWTKKRRPREATKRGCTLEEERRARAVRLSRLFHIAGTNALHSRQVRNGFIHIFEAVEEYVLDHPNEGISDWGRISPNPRYDEEYGKIIRCIDPTSLEIHHLTDIIDTRAMARELRQIQSCIIEHLPAEKKSNRQIRRLKKRGQELSEMNEDMKRIPFPDEWADPYMPPDLPEKPWDLLLQYVAIHNSLIDGGDPQKMGDLFSIHGEMGFYGTDAPCLDGRRSIVEAFRSHPPDEVLTIDKTILETENELVSIYGWGKRKPREGVLRLRVGEGKIEWLQVFKIDGNLAPSNFEIPGPVAKDLE